MNKLFNKIVFTIVVSILTILYAIPMYSAFINAFKSFGDMTKYPMKFPTTLYIDNFKEVFEKINLFLVYRNSIFITVFSVLIIIISSAFASYPIARFETKINKTVFSIFLLGLMIPQGLSLISLIKLLSKIGLAGTYQGLFLTYAGSSWIPFVMLIYIGFIRSLPVELDESAKIDGAGYFRIFWKVIFPLLKPCTGSAIIVTSLGIWNDFINPFIILGGGEGAKTITLAIFNFYGKYTTRYNLIFAVMVLAALPLVILFLFMQKSFIKGITAGALKG